MSECHYCHQPILENQILCMNCGSQIKPLEIKRRLFGGKGKIYLLIQHPFLSEKKVNTNARTKRKPHNNQRQNDLRSLVLVINFKD